jgi:predicted Zn finger-like uncharacterized protein
MEVRITCPNCNFSKTIPKEKIPSGVRYVKCPRCGNRFGLTFSERWINPGTLHAEKAEELELGAPPWENRVDFGVWSGIYRTFKLVLFSPGRFFGERIHDRRIGEPFAFGLLFGSLGIMLGLFWQFLILSGRTINSVPIHTHIVTLHLIFIGIVLLSPAFVIVNLFFTSGIVHLCLLLFRGALNGFSGTFRVVAYSQAAQVLSFVPFIGGLVGWVWYYIILILGLQKIHRASIVKVIIAILVVFVVKLVMLLPFFIFQSILKSLFLLG